jgi:hypothetical protein
LRNALDRCSNISPLSITSNQLNGERSHQLETHFCVPVNSQIQGLSRETAADHRRDPNATWLNNSITGDARRSSVALGKMQFDMKVDYAVKQIRELLGGAKASQLR